MVRGDEGTMPEERSATAVMVFTRAPLGPGSVGSPTDLREEVTQTLEELERDFAQAGLAFQDLAKLRIFYTSTADYPVFNSVRDAFYRARFPERNYPATTGIIMPRRTGPMPRIEFEAVASSVKKCFMSTKLPSNFSGVAITPAYSHATDVGDLTFISGQTGFDFSGQAMAEDAGDQMRQCLENIMAVLAAVGRTEADVVKFTVYVTEGSDADAVMKVYTNFITSHHRGAVPVLTLVSVSELFRPGLKVEVEAIASSQPHQSWPTEPPGSGEEPRLIMSSAVRVGEWVFANGGTSGVHTYANSEAALEAALGELRHALDQAGADVGDLVQCTAWLADQSAYGLVKKSLESLFANSAPPSKSSRWFIALMPPEEFIGSPVRLEAVGKCSAD